MQGASLVKSILLLLAALVVLLLLAVGFFEGRKAYWDYQVRGMCEKDGGTKLYQRVSLPKQYLDSDGFIRIPSSNKADINDLFSYSVETQKIKEGELAVYRYHVTVMRRSDSVLLGESVIYGRSGGDFPTFAYPSRFVCPENHGESQLINAIFLRNSNR
jgi:hypothetical protein